ncbi:MAG: DUF2304 domain-containing protein [Eubacteriales bacterium]
MSLFTQIFVALIILGFLFYVVSKLRREQIEFKYALVWIVSGVIILLLAIFPGILTWMAESIGVGLPVNLVFFLGIILNLIISFALTVTYSKLKNMIYRVTQMNAILDNDLVRTREELDKISRDAVGK